MSSAASRFVPREFLQLLGHDDLIDVERGDHLEKMMSIYFSDIRSFTTIVEGKTPEENFDFINEYLSYMEPSIQGHRGFIDSYEGDAIMALFERGADDARPRGVQGAPLEPIRHVERELTRPDGTTVKVKVPVYPPFRLADRSAAAPRTRKANPAGRRKKAS